MTVKTLIDGALRLLGVGSGSMPTPQEYQDALFALNVMLDSWTTDSGMIHSQQILSYSLLPNTYQYTLGSGGDWDTDAPVRIENINIVIGSFEIPLNIISPNEFSVLGGMAVTNTYPTDVYIQYDKLNTLYFWPAPAHETTVKIYAWSLLPQFDSINDEINLPQGYIQALKFNLAMALAPEFGKEAPANVVLEARRSKNAIKDENSTRNPYSLEYDGFHKSTTVANRTHGYIV